MRQFLNKDFLKSEDLYRECMNVWFESFQTTLGDHEEYYTKYSNNNSLLIDGNPIYSIKRGNRIVRIIQVKPSKKTKEVYDFYTTSIEDENGNIFYELVISLELTNRTLSDAVALSKVWLEGAN